ncbi:YbaB/EbfC family nucleoid-associated protein [Actinoallomurus rhizosphaericola]|uniref:YbaB/EbfC family nucleoid-associated protein n=1 Tax=Actinoallomurus rhizosphaericola TaxID=2952536 RepID=UPI00209331FF|nr:YbaB/EbfC family nucleoid-associated protein [Actinoallomurus rhizosphaericola]MCO5996148.1 YbaB/EbfC family nucleoid-associated protein [Actinoallomurus rhizosphaericola]
MSESVNAASGREADRGVGEAEDGRVRAVVTHGRMISLDVEPRLLRSSPEKLADHLTEAVNAAFADLLAAGAVPQVDPRALARQLRGLRDDLSAGMAESTASVQRSIEGLRGDAVVPSSVPTMDFAGMFDQLIDVLETIGGVPDEDTEELRGQGAVPGRISVTCAAGPRLVEMDLRERAMRSTPDLADAVTTAVNAALDDLADKLRRRREEAGADSERITGRIAELRELGVARLDAYVRQMTDFMAGIRPLD